jgi:hypothetical protein
MASRKTYFGIGFRDPNDPESGPAGAGDPQDRSQPTVVDDEKVAEGLRQLRRWYQGEAQPAGAEPAVARNPLPSPASTLGGGYARPTAVGHATGAPPAAAQRPIAPDPMRATMYGHDVHSFDLDPPPSGGEAAPAASGSTALVLADAGFERGGITRQEEAVPGPTPWPQPDSDRFPMARYGSGEAERLQRPVPVRQSSPARPASRIPTASRLMFAIGMLSLIGALALWLLSGNDSDAPAARALPAQATQALPAPAQVPSPPPVVPPTAAPATTEQGAIHPASSRPVAPGPTPVPIPTVAAPKAERPRAPATPAALRTPRRPREPKVLEEAKPDDEDGAKDEAKAAPKDEAKAAPKGEAKAAPKDEAKAAPKDEAKAAPKTRSRTTTPAPEKDSDATLPPSDL